MKEEYNEKTIIKNLLYHERLLLVRFLDWPSPKNYCDLVKFREDKPHIFRSCVGKNNSLDEGRTQ